jgi:cytidine deaminase
MKQVVFRQLSDIQKLALKKAEIVLENSYNPYSHFYVGACLVSDEHRFISGTNCENAAYGSCICAERSAILTANAMGIRKFLCLAITARGENFDTTEVTGPCGSCRQMLYEFSQVAGYDMDIVLSTTKRDKIVVTSINELLPLAFGPVDLGIDIAKYKK